MSDISKDFGAASEKEREERVRFGAGLTTAWLEGYEFQEEASKIEGVKQLSTPLENPSQKAPKKPSPAPEL